MHTSNSIIVWKIPKHRFSSNFFISKKFFCTFRSSWKFKSVIFIFLLAYCFFFFFLSQLFPSHHIWPIPYFTNKAKIHVLPTWPLWRNVSFYLYWQNILLVKHWGAIFSILLFFSNFLVFFIYLFVSTLLFFHPRRYSAYFFFNFISRLY